MQKVNKGGCIAKMKTVDYISKINDLLSTVNKIKRGAEASQNVEKEKNQLN